MAQRKLLDYRPALDGLRGIAVLLVILMHAGLLHDGAGTAGVTLFFVLSGYLITTILRLEHHDTGRINFRAFYGRRVRRLLPALAVYLIVTAAVLLSAGQSLRPVALAAGYASNFALASGNDLGALSHTWTLSLEEQFYFAWPLLLPLVARRRPALILTLAAVGSAALRTGLWLNGATLDRVYYSPDVRAEAILVGCALAFIKIPTRHLRLGAAMAALLLASGCVVGSKAQAPWLFTPAAIASAVLIAWAVHHKPRVLTFRPLVGLGKISYGLYLWHYPVAMFVFHRVGKAGLPVTLAISFALAAMSWYVIERPFMRRQVKVEADTVAEVVAPTAEVRVV
jgi:peptidoglycan/LPS O-acetylase OafA/YrhL